MVYLQRLTCIIYCDNIYHTSSHSGLLWYYFSFFHKVNFWSPLVSFLYFFCKISVFLTISNLWSCKTWHFFEFSVITGLSLMCGVNCAWYFLQKTHGCFASVYFSTLDKYIDVNKWLPLNIFLAKMHQLVQK